MLTVPARQKGRFTMMDMTTMPTGMMIGIGLVWLRLIIFLVLGNSHGHQILRS
jgi:hypothetical protein